MDEVVEVAADRPRRPIEGVDAPSGDRRQVTREQGLLDQGSNLHLLLDPFSLLGFCLLLPHQLRDLHRRCDLRGEAPQQTTVIRRVRLVREPWAEIERSEQLALADERDDELDALLSDQVQSLRLHVDRGQLQRPSVGEQHRLQGVTHGDGHRLDETDVRYGRGRRRGLEALFGLAPSHQLNHMRAFYSPTVPKSLRDPLLIQTPTAFGSMVDDTTDTHPSTTWSGSTSD